MSTALVPVAAAHPPATSYPQRHAHNAGFLAHLIATARHAPQTRLRRRAEPSEAVAVYAALGHRPTEPGRKLARWL